MCKLVKHSFLDQEDKGLTKLSNMTNLPQRFYCEDKLRVEILEDSSLEERNESWMTLFQAVQ